MNAADIVKALGGTWHGSYGLVPGPGHGQRDRSMKVTDGADGDIICHSFAGDDWRSFKDDLRDRGLLPNGEMAQLWRMVHGKRNLNQSKPAESCPARRTAAALEIWRASKPAHAQSLAAVYLRSRGINIPIAPSLRCHSSLKHGRTGQRFPAMVACVQGLDRKIRAIYRTYLMRNGAAKAVVSVPKMALGPIGAGAVRLGHVTETLMLTEGIEDALALMQMAGGTAWALLGTANFKNFIPPSEVRTIILAPDADPAGDTAVAEAAGRFSGMGLRVMRLRPPDGSDWCDCLDTFEERAGIAEFDGHMDCTGAAFAAFAELVGGEVRHAD